MLALRIFAKSMEYEDGVVMNLGVIKTATDAVNAASERDIADRKEMVLKELVFEKVLA